MTQLPESTLTFAYEAKNFYNTTAHVLAEFGYDPYTSVDTNQSSASMLQSAAKGLKAGTRIRLCHGNDYGVCSNVVAVTGEGCSSAATIASITNANPDAEGTNVPTGVFPMGQFRFTGGTGTSKIASLSFAVWSTNATIDGTYFKLYNKADASMKLACKVVGGGGSSGTGGGSVTSWTNYVECSGIVASGMQNSIAAGQNAVFVLETNVQNAKVSSASPSATYVLLTGYSLAGSNPIATQVLSTRYRS